ncbi:DUF1801 domain-containing protein [Pedobacter fastidiosus]|uniref:DUF1801 domain-containing protein n=1 Tax=Pedobacter fastidiosus TaxID=2765361 RepID=A0ABR7KV37_9SPHI|nr:DUF1801 domain-containing protein [Pedobacter fastidiosus]MBC6111975.1 DUF1801 domain-containing protein [Pedobacter fastidiosus]
MKSTAKTPDEYLNDLPDERKPIMNKLRATVLDNLPFGFEECIAYGMLGYVVPHSIYPPGYHCDPKLPLMFMSIASQKNAISFHHLGIYSDPKLLDWFTTEYPKHCKTKLDMGKGCIRFKKLDDIPFDLIAELVRKINPQQWIAQYESVFKK